MKMIKTKLGIVSTILHLSSKMNVVFEDLFLFDKSVGSARELHIAIITIIGTEEDSRSLLDLL